MPPAPLPPPASTVSVVLLFRKADIDALPFGFHAVVASVLASQAGAGVRPSDVVLREMRAGSLLYAADVFFQDAMLAESFFQSLECCTEEYFKEVEYFAFLGPVEAVKVELNAGSTNIPPIEIPDVPGDSTSWHERWQVWVAVAAATVAAAAAVGMACAAQYLSKRQQVFDLGELADVDHIPGTPISINSPLKLMMASQGSRQGSPLQQGSPVKALPAPGDASRRTSFRKPATVDKCGTPSPQAPRGTPSPSRAPRSADLPSPPPWVDPSQGGRVDRW
eukprot:583373-Prorocentrum_minimum.AAC.1